MSAKKKLLDYFLSNVGKECSRAVLSKIASVHDWQRIVRTLRQEGWQLESTQHGYILHSPSQSNSHASRTAISGKLRYAILQRDASKCRRCGKTVEDNIKLEVDHKLPVEWGGTNDPDNLWILCNICNGGKKHFFSDFDQEVMLEVSKEQNGYQRLYKLFLLMPNEIIEPLKLEVISGIRDWTRTLRLIREKEKINIAWIYPSKEYPNGGYVHEKKL